MDPLTITFLGLTLVTVLAFVSLLVGFAGWRESRRRNRDG